MKFTKMHGIGNDYVYVDCFTQRLDGVDLPDLARKISDRHRGVGSDGLILICPSDRADAAMVMYNADGSRAEMCGNGIRCLAKYVYEHRLSGATAEQKARFGDRPQITVATDAGVLQLDLLLDEPGKRVESVRVDMGRPRLAPDQIPTTLDGPVVADRTVTIAGRQYTITCVSMGNPHTVIFVDDFDGMDLARQGRAIEHADVFPARTNVHSVRVDTRSRLTMLTWERGSGATLACGTGACAACVAAAVTGRADRCVTVSLPGGALQIEFADDDRVYMTGPAEEVFCGDWPL
jgi:diaminopimelate epimerase